MALQILIGPEIAAGQSLSAGLDCSAGPLVRITFPPLWTPANLTFQLSSDGGLYNDLFDAWGKEVTMVVTPGAAVRIPLEWSPMVQFLKVRSGTRNHPVVQPEMRQFAVAIDVP